MNKKGNLCEGRRGAPAGFGPLFSTQKKGGLVERDSSENLPIASVKIGVAVNGALRPGRFAGYS